MMKINSLPARSLRAGALVSLLAGLLTCLASLLTSPVRAQGSPKTTDLPPAAAPADGTWSLQECISYALVYSINVKQAQLQVVGSQALLNQARAGLLPSVNGNVSYNSSTGRSQNPFTNTFEDQNIQSNQLSATAFLNVFSGFQQVNTIKQQLLARQSNELTVEQNKNLTALNVALAYLQVLQTKELVGVSQFQVASTEQSVNRTQRLIDAGSQPINTLLDLQAQLANDELALVTARNNLDLARLNLVQNMNLPADQSFDIDTFQLNDPATEDYPESAQQIYDLAVGSQPNVRAADLLIESNRRGVAAARGALFPSLGVGYNLGANYSTGFQRQVTPPTQTVSAVPGAYANVSGTQVPIFFPQTVPGSGVFETAPYFTQLQNTLNQVAFARLSIPIFGNFQRRTQVAQAVIQQKSSELTALNARIQLRQTIEQAYTSMTLGRKQFTAFSNQVRALELSFKNAEARFNVGALNAFDFSIAKNNLNRAQANVVQAKYNYIFRLKVLDFYQNKPLTF